MKFLKKCLLINFSVKIKFKFPTLKNIGIRLRFTIKFFLNLSYLLIFYCSVVIVNIEKPTKPDPKIDPKYDIRPIHHLKPKKPTDNTL